MTEPKTVKARKTYVCHACGCKISTNTKHVVVKETPWDGLNDAFITNRYHLECYSFLDENILEHMEDGDFWVPNDFWHALVTSYGEETILAAEKTIDSNTNKSIVTIVESNNKKLQT